MGYNAHHLRDCMDDTLHVTKTKAVEPAIDAAKDNLQKAQAQAVPMMKNAYLSAGRGLEKAKVASVASAKNARKTVLPYFAQMKDASARKMRELSNNHKLSQMLT